MTKKSDDDNVDREAGAATVRPQLLLGRSATVIENDDAQSPSDNAAATASGDCPRFQFLRFATTAPAAAITAAPLAATSAASAIPANQQAQAAAAPASLAPATAAAPPQRCTRMTRFSRLLAC